MQKKVFDIAYGFPIIVMRRVGPPKKKLPKTFGYKNVYDIINSFLVMTEISFPAKKNYFNLSHTAGKLLIKFVISLIQLLFKYFLMYLFSAWHRRKLLWRISFDYRQPSSSYSFSCRTNNLVSSFYIISLVCIYKDNVAKSQLSLWTKTTVRSHQSKRTCLLIFIRTDWVFSNSAFFNFFFAKFCVYKDSTSI